MSKTVPFIAALQEMDEIGGIRSGWVEDMGVQLDRHGTGWAGELSYMGARMVTDAKIRAGVPPKEALPKGSRFQADFARDA